MKGLEIGVEKMQQNQVQQNQRNQDDSKKMNSGNFSGNYSASFDANSDVDLDEISTVIRDSVTKTVQSVVHAMEPKINEMATRAAIEAIDRSGEFARLAVREVRRQPWYLVGAAAVLLIGAAFMIGFESDKMSSDLDSPTKA